MQLPLNGGSYKHPYIDVNFQRCVNMFPMTAGPGGRGNKTSVPTQGLDLLIDLGFDAVRNVISLGEFVYVTCGVSIYKLTINYLTKTAVSSLIGTIATTSGTVYSTANPTQIIWVDGSTKGYIYNINTLVFQEITATDADFTGGSNVQFLDGYFILAQPNTGKLFTSALNNGLSWDPLDVGTAESSTDNIVALGKSKGELWVFGSETVEIWYDAANVSGIPLSPRVGLGMQIGCGAPDSVAAVNDLLVWLDNRGFVVQSSVSPFIRSNNSGYDLNIVSDESMTTEILSYTRRDDAIAMSYNDRGHIMYQITFPTAKKTWVYDYTQKEWHERAYYDSYLDSLVSHLGQFTCTFKSLQLMGGLKNGKIYISSETYFDDDGVDIRRIRTTPVQLDNQDYKLVGVDGVELRMASGDAPQGIIPYVSMRYSHDGGHTWSYEMEREIGRVGEYGKSIRWNRLGVGREWIFEFLVVSSTKFALIDAAVSVSSAE